MAPEARRLDVRPRRAPRQQCRIDRQLRGPVPAYIDGIENDSDIDIESERRLPPGTQHHVNYYQRSDFFIRGNSGADVNVNSTPWSGDLQHTGIDDHANVRSGVQDPLVSRVTR